MMGSKSLKIVMYGAAGAGKDTHAEELSEKFGIPHFSAGQILRDEAATDTQLGRSLRPYLQTGGLVPDKVAAELVHIRLLSNELRSTGYIVNGYPRTIEALKHYLAFDQPTLVIHLVISDDVIRERLSARGRADDTPETIERRIERYKETEKPVCEWIKQNTDIPLVEVDSTGPYEEVSAKILEAMEEILGFEKIRSERGANL